MEDEITYPPSHPLSRFKNVLWSLEFLTAVKNSEKELNLLTGKDLVILFGNKAKGSVDYKPFEVLLQLANDVVLAEISELPLGKLDKQLVSIYYPSLTSGISSLPKKVKNPNVVTKHLQTAPKHRIKNLFSALNALLTISTMK